MRQRNQERALIGLKVAGRGGLWEAKEEAKALHETCARAKGVKIAVQREDPFLAVP
jgi:hypothetical protein